VVFGLCAILGPLRVIFTSLRAIFGVLRAIFDQSCVIRHNLEILAISSSKKYLIFPSLILFSFWDKLLGKRKGWKKACLKELIISHSYFFW
jgi:hypothetical protein